MALNAMVGEAQANMVAFCQLLKVENLEQLPARQFDSAVALLKAKKSAPKKETAA